MRRKGFDVVEFHNSREWAKVKKLWCEWPEEVQGWLRDRPDLVEGFYERVVLSCAAPETLKKYLKGASRERMARMKELLGELRQRIQERHEQEKLEFFRSRPKKKRARYSLVVPTPLTSELLECSCSKCPPCTYSDELGPELFSILKEKLAEYEKSLVDSSSGPPWMLKGAGRIN